MKVKFIPSEFLTVYDCSLLNKNIIPTLFCWYWKGAKTKKGYPTIHRGNSYGKLTTVHSLICEVFNGKPRTSGLVAKHSCNNPSCVSPFHVSWGSQRSNIKDSYKANRRLSPAEYMRKKNDHSV